MAKVVSPTPMPTPVPKTTRTPVPNNTTTLVAKTPTSHPATTTVYASPTTTISPATTTTPSSNQRMSGDPMKGLNVDTRHGCWVANPKPHDDTANWMSPCPNTP
jgi:hypothetical protein